MIGIGLGISFIAVVIDEEEAYGETLWYEDTDLFPEDADLWPED